MDERDSGDYGQAAETVSDEQLAKERATYHGVVHGGVAGIAYPISAEQLAEDRERERRYQEGQLRQAALSSAIQYGHGHSRSASETIEDAAAFLKFLTVA